MSPLVDGWKLVKYIAVAVDTMELPVDRERVIDQSLRDYRNLVHPTKEARSGRTCGEAEGMLAFGALIAVINQFAANP